MVLSLGALLSQAALLAAIPILSRLYSPADFGALAVFAAVCGIAATAFTARFDAVITIPEGSNEARSLVVLCGLIALFAGGLACLVFFVFRHQLGRLLGIQPNWIVPAVAAGICSAIVAAGIAWFGRLQQYKLISQVRVAQSATLSILAIILGLAGIGSGLLIAQLVGWLLTAGAVFVVVAPRVRGISMRDIGEAARNHISAPALLLPTALLDIITLQLPVVVIATFYSVDDAGQFSMAWKVLSAPMLLIGSAVGQVFFQTAARDVASRKPTLMGLYVKVSIALGAVSILPAIGIVLYGERLFVLAFGTQWRHAGEMAQFLVMSSAFYFVFSPTSSLLILLNRRNLLLLFAIIQLLYRSCVALYAEDVFEYVKLLVVCEVLNVILFELVILRVLGAASPKVANS